MPRRRLATTQPPRRPPLHCQLGSRALAQFDPEQLDSLLGGVQQHDIPLRRANTEAELQALLDSDFRGLIVSMIHKFEERDRAT